MRLASAIALGFLSGISTFAALHLFVWSAGRNYEVLKLAAILIFLVAPAISALILLHRSANIVLRAAWLMSAGVFSGVSWIAIAINGSPGLLKGHSLNNPAEVFESLFRVGVGLTFVFLCIYISCILLTSTLRVARSNLLERVR